ncbi:response regulator transcription factor [Cellulosimicrobium cellulans]|uniref:response regulator transcription factor n=1 Tax=Cellulosimicrobium cellulans TaxID=1710 RepID=UPI00240606AB|nr:response regulator transcription factor [Cellulosimicrobium cellulans]MDF9876191.1 two-component system OmpR family response regulator [Cellulosimicrobium cellulans]
MADDNRTAVIVEDDAEIRELLQTVLGQAGFTTEAAATGVEGVELVRRTDPVVTTLDVSLPDIDGFEVCRRIRRVSDTYVVMLTARTDEIDTLLGLDAGADDYQTKPFRPRELRARIEALLRRPRHGSPAEGVDRPRTAPPPGEPGLVGADGLLLDVPRRTATVDGSAVHLTRSEYDILGALVEASGRVVSRNELVRVLWGEEYDAGTYVTDADRRSVEVHVANLRRKLGDGPTTPRWIRTVRGVGYRFDPMG